MTHPVLALIPLDPVLLPGRGPEEGRGDVWETTGDETPHTPVLLHGLSVVADDTGPTAVDLTANPGVPITLAQSILPLVLDNVGHLVGKLSPLFGGWVYSGNNEYWRRCYQPPLVTLSYIITMETSANSSIEK